jgi:hypothetical protein
MTITERIERALGLYIDSVGEAYDFGNIYRALTIEFDDEPTLEILNLAIEQIAERITANNRKTATS